MLKSGKSQGILIGPKIESSQSVIFCCISKQHIHWMTGYGSTHVTESTEVLDSGFWPTGFRIPILWIPDSTLLNFSFIITFCDRSFSMTSHSFSYVCPWSLNWSEDLTFDHCYALTRNNLSGVVKNRGSSNDVLSNGTLCILFKNSLRCFFKKCYCLSNKTFLFVLALWTSLTFF